LWPTLKGATCNDPLPAARDDICLTLAQDANRNRAMLITKVAHRRHGICILVQTTGNKQQQQQKIYGKEYPLPFLPEKTMTKFEMATTAFTGAFILLVPIVLAVMLVR
jgi:hypothetical protein